MRQFDAPVALNPEIAPGWRLLSFGWPPDLPPPAAGQFFTVRPAASRAGEAPLLRRPFAFASFGSSGNSRTAQAIYQTRGPATTSLSSTSIGSCIDIIAPLGKPFPMPDSGERPLLAAGGIGLGPVLFLASTLVSKGMKAGRDFDLVLGFRDGSCLPRFPPGCGETGLGFSSLLGTAILCTDDGSLGIEGTVMDGIASLGSTPRGTGSPHLYGCGPAPMLAALASWAIGRGFPAHLSAEQWMACGVGACHGCVLPATGGAYLRACSDGPVFEAGRILWGECR